MSDEERGAADMETGERMSHLASAMGNAMGHKMHGESQTSHGANQRMTDAQARAVVADWPEAPKKGALQMMEQYGPPNEGTPTKLFWYGNGPWKRTMVTSDVIVHNFPAPHSDYLTQAIDYRVPTDLLDDIGVFDGSCLVDRTSGEVAARCDSEAANFITLNLMHEIAMRKRTVDDARKAYAEAMAAYATGRLSPYAERLLFAVPPGDTADPDESMMAGAAMHQMVGKVKDALSGTPGQARSDGQGAGEAASSLIGDAPRSGAFPYEKSQ